MRKSAAPRVERCAACHKSPLEKDEVSATKKFLGKGQLYCLACLAEITGFEVDELKERIRELKEEGCSYFS